MLRGKHNELPNKPKTQVLIIFQSMSVTALLLLATPLEADL